MDAASGDADGDGDIDLALAMECEPNVLLLNDGAGINELLLCNRASSGAPGRAATSGGQLRFLSR